MGGERGRDQGSKCEHEREEHSVPHCSAVLLQALSATLLCCVAAGTSLWRRQKGPPLWASWCVAASKGRDRPLVLSAANALVQDAHKCNACNVCTEPPSNIRYFAHHMEGGVTHISLTPLKDGHHCQGALRCK
eukprot:1152168-Pelagomonas_calceolata.AAC.10